MGGKQVGYSSLLFLLKNKERLNIDIVAVFENAGSPLAESRFSIQSLAEEYGLRIHTDLADLCSLEKVDFIFSVQYNKILTKEQINVAHKLAVNLHMAPLPEYRGCNQFSFAIIDQAREFGTTLHRLEESTDAGDILFESRFPMQPDIFVTELYELTLTKSIELFEQSVEDILLGNYQQIPQKQLHAERGTSFHLRSEIQSIKRINSDWPVEKQKRYFRATFFPAFPSPVLVAGDTTQALDMDWFNSI